MPKAYIAVRAEVPESERARFDHWYETDHLPWALREFAARRDCVAALAVTRT